MARVARRDAAACRALVERHLGRLVAFAQRVLGTRADAEDVAQEVFIRVWTHAGRYRPDRARLTTWLHRVALNLCLDRLGHRRDAPIDQVPELHDPAPAPASRLAAQDLGRRVQAALSRLPDRQRIAITLCHHQGFSGREAAEILGVSPQAVESLLARGRRAMRDQLRDVAADFLGARR